MTMQVTDRVLLRSQQYALLCKSGGPMFDPRTHGLKPVFTNTANWRGFVCQFAIQEEMLFLDSVNVNTTRETANSENHPLLLGKSAEISWLSDRFTAAGIPFPTYLPDTPSLVYKDIGAFLPYTSALVLATARIDSGNALVRYQRRICHYADVREILLRDGRVLQEYDRSEAIAAIREKMLAMTEAEQFAKSRQIRQQK